jgi:hypothetical protein
LYLKTLKNAQKMDQFAVSKLKLFQNNNQWKLKEVSARGKIPIFIP